MKSLFFLLVILFSPTTVSAAEYFWDGGGSTQSWSEAANWSANIVPTSSDTVIFSASSTKNANIDSDFGGTVTALSIRAGYTGVITQERTFSVTTVTHSSSTFQGSSSTLHNINLIGVWTQNGTSTFVSTAGSLILTSSGKLTMSGTNATFTHNSGTVDVRGDNTTVMSLNTNGGAGSITLYNLTVNNSGTFPTYFESEDTINVINDLNLTDGSVGSARIVVLGNVTTTGSVTISSNWGGSWANPVAGGIIVSSTYAIPLSLPRINTLPAMTFKAPNAIITWTGSGSVIGFYNGGGTESFTMTTGTLTFPTTSTVTMHAAFSMSGGTLSTNTTTFGSTFTLSGGTFNGGEGNHTIAAAYSQTGGTYTKTSGDVSYATTWTMNGNSSHTATAGTSTVVGAWVKTTTSTFNHNNGTFETNIYNAAAFEIGTNGGAGTVTFYNLNFNPPNQCGYIDPTDMVYVANNLTMTNGTLCGGFFHAIGNNATTATVTFGVNFDGAYGTYSNTGYVVVTGTYPMSVIFTGGGTLPGIIFNNTSAVASTTGSGTVSCYNFSVTNCFDLRAGTVNMGSNSFWNNQAYVQSGGTFNGGSGAEYFTTDWTLSGGTYNATTGNTNFYGAYTHTAGGTFSHGGGTTRFVSAAATVNVNSTETFANLEIVKTTANTLTISSGDTLVATGTMNFTDGLVSGGTIEARGNITVSTTYDGGGTTPLLLSGSSDQIFTLSASTFDADVTIRKTSPTNLVTLNTAMVLNGTSQDLTITTGTLDIAGYNLTVNGTSGTFIIAASGTLKMVGTETLTFNSGYPLFRVGSTASYYSTSTITMKDFTYHNIVIEGDGTFSLAASETLGGSMTLTTGTISLAGNNLTINSTNTFTNSGVTRLVGNETINFTISPSVGTVEYFGTSTFNSLLGGNSYNNLRFSGSGIWNQNANVDVNGNLTIDPGSTLKSNDYDLTLAGNWSNSGTYFAGANTTTLDGANQTVSGTTRFHKFFKVSTTTSDVLYFTAGSTFTVTNTLKLLGSSNGLLYLRSTVTDSVWYVDPQGTRDIQYVDVQDSSNIGTAILAYESNNVNSGNNSGWTFSRSSGGATNSPPLVSAVPPEPPPAPAVSPNPTPPPVVSPNPTPPPNSEPPVSPPLPVTSTPSVVEDRFTVTLRLGSRHAEVVYLQQLLNYFGFTVAKRGAGSPGRESNYFGSATRNALLRYQKARKIRQSLQADVATRVMLNKDWRQKLLAEIALEELTDFASLTQEVASVKIFIPAFTRDLRSGAAGDDVKRLQQWLNANGYIVAASGAGSPGQESSKFGLATAKAVARFQEAHAAEILTPLKLKKGTGVFSVKTRSVINSLIQK